MKILMRLLKSGCAILCLAAPAQGLAADALSDPTQSPMEMAVSGPGGADPGVPVLQSVMLSAGRKVAVINGQPYKVGEQVGEATLARVTDHEAVLRNADGTLQTLSMHPAVVKKVIVQPQESGLGTRKSKRPVTRAGQTK